jgi:hypothetical protein
VVRREGLFTDEVILPSVSCGAGDVFTWPYPDAPILHFRLLRLLLDGMQLAF